MKNANSINSIAISKIKALVNHFIESKVNHNFTVLMVKPDGVGRGIIKELEHELFLRNLVVVYDFTVFFDRTLAIKFYPGLGQPSEYGDTWKEDVIMALQEGPCIVYVIAGENAVLEVLKLRNTIRQKYTDRSIYIERVVRNLLHASDTPEEAVREVSILLDVINKESPNG